VRWTDFGGTAKPGGMYREIDVRSPFEWKGYLCWLRQRDTYPATPVAPLSKGDAAAVTLVNAIDADVAKRQL